MILLIVIIIVVGLAGIIGNQYSGLQRMNQMQKTLDEIKASLQEKGQ
ncbi:hypothetical protein [Cohnella luojiensis]|nr:hypothetical protein [Cohnella luojiensis]